MLVDIQMPLEPFNARVKDGTAGRIIHSILTELKHEAAYFAARDGKRTTSSMCRRVEALPLPEPFFLH
jgi:hypothetical protein